MKAGDLKMYVMDYVRVIFFRKMEKEEMKSIDVMRSEYMNEIGGPEEAKIQKCQKNSSSPLAPRGCHEVGRRYFKFL